MKKEKEDKEPNVFREMGRIIAGSYYEHQQIRIQEFNRTRDIIYRKMEGLDLTEIQKKKPEEEKYLEKFKDQFLSIYTKILEREGKISGNEKEYIERVMEVQKNAQKYEKEYEKLMNAFVKEEKIYNEFLKNITGISTVISTNLLKEFGYCERAPHISSLWKYAGLHVTENGKSIKREKGHQLEFPLKVRTMVWKIGDCLMKLNFYKDEFGKKRASFYRKVYDTEKIKQAGREYNAGTLFKKYGKPYKKEDTKLSKGHVHSRALRKMNKIFLAHYWLCAKELTKQEITEPYAKDMLGHTHISSWREGLK